MEPAAAANRHRRLPLLIAAAVGVRWIRVLGIALSAVAVLLGAIAIGAWGDPCSEREPDWLSPLLAVAAGAAAGAVACGVVTLVRRDWIAALAMLAIGPLFFVAAAFGSVCWN